MKYLMRRPSIISRLLNTTCSGSRRLVLGFGGFPLCAVSLGRKDAQVDSEFITLSRASATSWSRRIYRYVYYIYFCKCASRRA